jgi:hypothetical protein
VRILLACRPLAFVASTLGLLAVSAAGAAPARADLLELTDGRVVEGAVELTPEGYRVRSRFGETVVPKAQVKAHTPGRTVDELVKERLAGLEADDAENRARLAAWLVELGRADEGRALAEAALEIDPENAAAHGVLGHERHGGRWTTHDEAMRAKGLECHDGRWYTPEEWKNLEEAPRKAALEADAKAEAKRRADDVNRLVRLLASPDPAVRARAKKRLEQIADESGNADLKAVIGRVEQYVAAADELARAAASGATGSVLSELRVTMSKLKRPIQEFSTSLASNIGGAPVRIQLPELEVVKVRTMVGLPATVGP